MNQTYTPTQPPRVRWGVFIVESDRLHPLGLVGPMDESVFVAIVTPGETHITLELYRGDRLRDRRQVPQALVDGKSVVAVRLGRSDSPTGSSRLRCRLLVNDVAIGERTVLLGAPAIDAQGRLTESPGAATEATRMAYVRFLNETWRFVD